MRETRFLFLLQSWKFLAQSSFTGTLNLLSQEKHFLEFAQRLIQANLDDCVYRIYLLLKE